MSVSGFPSEINAADDYPIMKRTTVAGDRASGLDPEKTLANWCPSSRLHLPPEFDRQAVPEVSG